MKEKRDQKIESLYLSGLKIVEVANEIGINRNLVSKILRQREVEIKIPTAHPNVNCDYFETIDSKEKAYWLGFLYADGYNNQKKGFVVLDLSEKDKKQIFKFCDALNLNKEKIKLRVHKCGSKSHSVKVNSRKMSDDLGFLGCVQSKSKIVRFPFNKIDIKYYLPFLSGVYDGDGSWKNYYLYSGAKQFLEDIKSYYGLEFEVKKRGSVFSLNIGKELKNKMETSYPNSMIRKRWVESLGGFDYSTKQKEYYISRRKIKRPSYKQLMKEVDELGYTGAGKKYNVSDNAIRNWVKWYKKFGEVTQLVE